jgi:hypothetical protein
MKVIIPIIGEIKDGKVVYFNTPRKKIKSRAKNKAKNKAEIETI